MDLGVAAGVSVLSFTGEGTTYVETEDRINRTIATLLFDGGTFQLLHPHPGVGYLRDSGVSGFPEGEEYFVV